MRKDVTVVEMLEQTTTHVIVRLSNEYRAKFEFTREIPEHAVLHWNGLTCKQVNAIVKEHNEKGFY